MDSSRQAVYARLPKGNKDYLSSFRVGTGRVDGCGGRFRGYKDMNN